jgi:hypothetical protein
LGVGSWQFLGGWKVGNWDLTLSSVSYRFFGFGVGFSE